MVKRRFTADEILYLHENYSNLGASACADALQRALPYVKKKANALGLRVDKSMRYARYGKTAIEMENRISIAPFRELSGSCFVYFLGLLWADGHVSKRGCRISLTLKRQDFVALLPVFLNLGDWHIFWNKKRNQGILYVSHQALHELLRSYGFWDKSLVSPGRLLSFIPTPLLPIFWRGFFDGDGCIWVSNKRHCVSLTGAFSQDWSDLFTLLDGLGVFYHYLQRDSVNKGRRRKCSVVYFFRRDSILRFFSYIYASEPLLGLSRKQDIFRSLLSLPHECPLRLLPS